MSRSLIGSAEEIGGLLAVLEHDRLELVEAIAGREKYNNADLEKLSLFGSAIQSVKDAIAFGKELDV